MASSERTDCMGATKTSSRTARRSELAGLHARNRGEPTPGGARFLYGFEKAAEVTSKPQAQCEGANLTCQKCHGDPQNARGTPGAGSWTRANELICHREHKVTDDCLVLPQMKRRDFRKRATTGVCGPHF